MGIDISKIKAGDKITVELTVTTKPLRHSSLGMAVFADRGYPFTDHKICIAVESIISHTPAPWVPKAGDVAYCPKSDSYNSGYRAKILYIDADGDWFCEFYYLHSSVPPSKGVVPKNRQDDHELAPSN